MPGSFTTDETKSIGGKLLAALLEGRRERKQQRTALEINRGYKSPLSPRKEKVEGAPPAAAGEHAAESAVPSHGFDGIAPGMLAARRGLLSARPRRSSPLSRSSLSRPSSAPLGGAGGVVASPAHSEESVESTASAPARLG